MADFLTRRKGIWHFVRRVPNTFRHLDKRGIVRISTCVKVADDRVGRRATRAAQSINADLERYWAGLAGLIDPTAIDPDQARMRARALGFEYVENENLLSFPLEKRLERIEALLEKNLLDDKPSRVALLGTAKRETFRLSKVFEEYKTVVLDEIRDLSPDQLRIWCNGRIRSVEQFVKVVGDKWINEITLDDGIDYIEWWRGRIIDGEVNPKTANKDIGQLSRMLKDLSVRRRLILPEIFKGLRLRGESEKSRLPFDTDFIRSRFLSGAGFDGLNEDAKLVLHVMIETGMRPSDIVNLTSETIMLKGDIPYVRIIADGRRLKTSDSEREIPLVGCALTALRARPGGFPKYRDKATVLSATVNKYMTENALRSSRDHTVYSLRHSFKDRLIASEAPDSLIDALMGHRTNKPKYGKGHSLELKLKYLQRTCISGQH